MLVLNSASNASCLSRMSTLPYQDVVNEFWVAGPVVLVVLALDLNNLDCLVVAVVVDCCWKILSIVPVALCLLY